MHDEFWTFLDQLIAQSEVVIERPAHSAHPHFAEMIYPLDYGYLAQTQGTDGAEIDVWVGTLAEKTLVGVLVSVDLGKRDSEIKLLLGCRAAEIEQILVFMNQGALRALYVPRG